MKRVPSQEGNNNSLSKDPILLDSSEKGHFLP